MTAVKMIRDLRENGMRPGEIARRVHVTPATLARWERGTFVPRTQAMSRLAKLHGEITRALTDAMAHVEPFVRCIECTRQAQVVFRLRPLTGGAGVVGWAPPAQWVKLTLGSTSGMLCPTCAEIALVPLPNAAKYLGTVK